MGETDILSTHHQDGFNPAGTNWPYVWVLKVRYKFLVARSGQERIMGKSSMWPFINVHIHPVCTQVAQ